MKKESEIDKKIALAFEKLTQVQRILLWERAKNEKLSPIQIQFLTFLDRHSKEKRKVGVLADEFDLSKATVSDAISNLVSKGLLLKEKTKTDKRSSTLRVTDKGKRVLKRVQSWQDILIKYIGEIKNYEKEAVYLFLTELIKNLFDGGIIHTARICSTCGNLHKGSSGDPNKCGLTGREFFDSGINIDCDSHLQVQNNHKRKN